MYLASWRAPQHPQSLHLANPFFKLYDRAIRESTILLPGGKQAKEVLRDRGWDNEDWQL
jgi:hypothetical protein